ncbi:MAG: GGDEF domain-containing protein [Phycisphaerae bacterium]
MRTFFQQFYRGLFGLQFRTTALLTFVVLAATGLTGATYLRISSRITLAQTKKQVRDMARALASACSDAVERQDREELLSVAEGSVPGSEICYILFTDTSGELLASHQQGTGNITHLILDDARRVSVEPIDRPQLSYHGDQGPRIDVVYPIQSRMNGITSLPRPIVGYVRVGVSLEGSTTRLATLVRNTIGLAIGITLLMVPLGYEVVRNLIGPLNSLSAAACVFAHGKLDTRVKINRRDEIGKLATSFNSMADELADSQTRLIKLNEELEGRVQQRTSALEEANKRFREMAARDSLTGLYNRRHFNDLLSQLFAESSRYQTDLTCMMIDLDNFKRVNDTLGHQVGDTLLRMTSDVIQQSIRESDVPVRYGGDEFIVLLPRTTPEDARSSAERILDRFRSELAREMPQANVVSLSIGLASRLDDQPNEALALVQLADEALYLAKAGGKDRITVVQPVPTNANG